MDGYTDLKQGAGTSLKDGYAGQVENKVNLHFEGLNLKTCEAV